MPATTMKPPAIALRVESKATVANEAMGGPDRGLGEQVARGRLRREQRHGGRMQANGDHQANAADTVVATVSTISRASSGRSPAGTPCRTRRLTRAATVRTSASRMLNGTGSRTRNRGSARRASAGSARAAGLSPRTSTAAVYVMDPRRPRSIAGRDRNRRWWRRRGSAPVRLTLAQALNSLGGTIAPWIAGAFILTSKVMDPAEVAKESPADQHAYQVSIAHTVHTPYIVIAIGLAVMGIAIALTHLPHISGSHESEATEIVAKSMRRSIWSYRHTVLAALGIFLYVGTEVGLATQMVLYFSDSAHHGLAALTTAAAQKLVAYYWGGALVGRLLGSWALTKIKADKLLGAFGLIAAALVVVSIVSTGTVAIWALILAGFFNSIMFPNIFALGIAGLGTMTSKGSGLIMTAVWGGALIPVFIGWISDHSTYALSLLVPVVCYLYIAFFGFAGHKPARTATA